jgi:TolB-like protein
MPEKSDNPLNFWLELKRRKVVRVITVYAAAAFVILELVDIVTPSLGLPAWTLNFVIVLLCVGFILSIILSWVYDITPEGVQKTKPSTQANKEARQPASLGWKISTYMSVLVIIAFVAIYVISGIRNKSKIDPRLEKSIAVLPFKNLSEETGNEYFVDGLVEDLLNRLSPIKELRVTSRTSSEMYRERGIKSAPEIANELGVSYIVEGSVQRYGNKARITVQLVDATNDRHIWSQDYDREIGDIFETQSEIAMRIVSELKMILSSDQKAYIQENKTINLEAFELYQMGRYYWNKRTGEGYQKSIEYFGLAIAEDPYYGLAYAGLADSYLLMAIQGWIDRNEGRDKAVEFALKALELDDNLAEAYTVLGQVYDYIDWEWEKAERAFQLAFVINPNYATAHHYYAEHLSIIGKHNEAREHVNKAIELDPLSPVIRRLSSKIYYNQSYFSQALEAIKKCYELQKEFPLVHAYEFRVYWRLGEEEKSYEALRKILANEPVYDVETADNIFKSSGLISVINWKIEIDIARAENGNSYCSLALIHGLVGKDEQALYWLEKAIESGECPEMSFRLEFKNLHDNPRYIALLDKMGLTEYLEGK